MSILVHDYGYSKSTSQSSVVVQVIILARESGLKLELSNIPIESLVPEPLRVRINFYKLCSS